MDPMGLIRSKVYWCLGFRLGGVPRKPETRNEAEQVHPAKRTLDLRVPGFWVECACQFDLDFKPVSGG